MGNLDFLVPMCHLHLTFGNIFVAACGLTVIISDYVMLINGVVFITDGLLAPVSIL